MAGNRANMSSLGLVLSNLLSYGNDNAPDEAEFVISGISYKTTLADILELEDYKYPIGSGGFGTVYRKRHRQSNLVMAEKVVSKGSENLAKYAETEKELWKNCNHPQLVNHFGAIDTTMSIHLYFELMNTCVKTLKERLKLRLFQQQMNYNIPEEVLRKIAYSTYSALYYLKEIHDVIHRDIKPSNILIGNDGSIKVTDFGLARRLVDSRAHTTGIGSIAYLSPERINTAGAGYGSPADIWSIGVMLIELAIGQHPVTHDEMNCNELQILIQIAEDPPPVLPVVSFSPELHDFTTRCLQRDPASRIKLGAPHPFLATLPTDQSMLSWCMALNLISPE